MLESVSSRLNPWETEGFVVSTPTPADIPTMRENAPIIGESAIHTHDDLKKRRPQEVAFSVASLIRERFFKDDPGLFPQLLDIVKHWMAAGHIRCKDDTFQQMILFTQKANEAAEKVIKR